MRKEEFLRQLEYLLQDMPEKDKTEAIQYYRDYLEEAGPDNEERAVEEFGSPERVAAIIRADMMGNLEEGGAFTETGYEDERFRDPNYQVAKRFDLPEEKKDFHDTGRSETHYEESYSSQYGTGHDAGYKSTGASGGYTYVKKERWTCKPLKWALWAVLLIIASPFLLGAGGIAFGLVVGIVSLIAGLIFTIMGLTAAALIAAVVLIAFGVVFLASSPMEALLLIGIAVASFGCGLVGLAITVVLIGTFLPFLWRCLVKLVRMITGGGKEKKTA